jgi:hypothetical protein
MSRLRKLFSRTLVFPCRLGWRSSPARAQNGPLKRRFQPTLSNPMIGPPAPPACTACAHERNRLYTLSLTPLRHPNSIEGCNYLLGVRVHPEDFMDRRNDETIGEGPSRLSSVSECHLAVGVMQPLPPHLYVEGLMPSTSPGRRRRCSITCLPVEACLGRQRQGDADGCFTGAIVTHPKYTAAPLELGKVLASSRHQHADGWM